MAEQQPVNPEEKDGKSWLRRVLPQFLRERGRGDVIAGSVGAGARGVAVGKNIIQIGTVVIPTVPVLILLLVVLAGTGLVAAKTFLGPTQMSGRFNVALADVGELDADGRMHGSALSQLFSGWMIDELVAANQKYVFSNRVEIWHDRLPLSEKRVRLGMIAGKTPEDRTKAALELANHINADVVIYGHLTPFKNPTEFVLEFNVSPRLGREAGVTIPTFGRYQLGEPIQIPQNFSPTDTLAKEALAGRVANRATALFWLMLGLREDLLGRLNEAVAVYRQAEQVLTSWKDKGEGKEILYYFMGRALLFPQGDLFSLEHDAEAETAFQKALKSNPKYARAAIGLGSVYFRRAQNLAADKRLLEPKDLEKAIQAYDQALELAAESQEALMESIAHLARATAYRLQGDTYFHFRDDVQATHFFDLAIKETDLVLDPLAEARQYRLLAQAYLNLGTTYIQQADILREQGNGAGSKTLYEKAHTAYASCIEQGKRAPEDNYLVETIIGAGCQPLEQLAEEAAFSLGGETK